MELQLGLALPSNPMKGFDLNTYGFEPTEVLGSDPSSHVGSCFSSTESFLNKRSFDEAFDQEIDTLPLFFWNNHPNEEDGHRELDKNSSTVNNDGDDEGLVGWPPIKAWRKKLCHQSRTGGAGNQRVVDNFYGGGGAKSTYVKVKMEGVGIARKVDLSLYHSYQTLTDTLVGMFGSGNDNLKAYKLTYQDREGDWLLAGDVPWSSFILSVQRLKLLRSSD